MSKDPLGFDINSAPQAEISRIQNHNQFIDAYRQGIVLPAVSLVDDMANALAEMKVNAWEATPAQLAQARSIALAAAMKREQPMVTDQGKPLTLEERQRIAAMRKPYDPSTFAQQYMGEPSYADDLQDHKVEPLGASAQKIIDEKATRVALSRKI